MERKRIDQPELGIRAIDGFLTVGEGQRIGIFAGAGGWCKVLLGMLARNAQADVIILGLVGERGREVREFVEKDSEKKVWPGPLLWSQPAMKRSIAYPRCLISDSACRAL